MKRAAFVYPLIGLASVLAIPNEEECCRIPPAPCYNLDDSFCTFCLGPDQVNPSVRPRMCDGEVVFTAGALLWNSHQDGMEYAVDTVASGTLGQLALQVNTLIDANYKNPNFKWTTGFVVGVGYDTTHDGWDVDLLWTHYRGNASSHNETESDDAHTLIAIWSAFQNRLAQQNIATDIETHWRLHLDFLDASLGREFWVSKYLTLRPFIGLRAPWINQSFIIQHKGGTWNLGTSQPLFNNQVDLKNDFHGIGPRGGLDTTWHFREGFSLYNHLAAALIYGRFHVKHDEWNRQVQNRHEKTRVLETEEHFRAGRAILDLSLGVQWTTLFNRCRNQFSLLLAWDHHLFFQQNQMWRVNRRGGSAVVPAQFPGASFYNDSGENVYYQRRGDLDTQGWTFKINITF